MGINPLDRARAFEVVWDNVEPIFKIGKALANPAYVYFIGEEDSGPVKIGSAKNPITRLRSLQVGNPRRLRLEYVLLGEMCTERMFHQFWSYYAIRSLVAKGKPSGPVGTEWFRASIREPLFPILDSAIAAQCEAHKQMCAWVIEDGKAVRTVLERSYTGMENAIRQAHDDHGFVPHHKEQERYLAA